MSENLNQVAQTLPDNNLEKVAGGYGGQTVAVGSFASQTGTQLNLLVNWSISMDGAGQRTLNVTVSATSYSLYAAGIAGGLELIVNGMCYTTTPNAVNYSGRSMAAHTLGSFTIPNIYGAASITANWVFNGSYSGTWLGTISASGIAAG